MLPLPSLHDNNRVQGGCVLETQQWHYVINGNQAGPVPESELVQMLTSGQLAPETLVWTQSLEDWVAASSVDALMNPTPVSPTPTPVSPVPAASAEMTADSEAAEAAEVTYAGFWKRVAACLIDGVIMTMAGLFVGATFGVIYGVVLQTAAGAGFFGNAIGILMQWAYFALMESSANQATVGKMALGIKVTDLDGNRLSFGRATGRHFGKIISGLTLGIGYLMVAFMPRKQALHDIMAGCLVVNRDN
jgi:uncharacterized RDD family membrane protein YckC